METTVDKQTHSLRDLAALLVFAAVVRLVLLLGIPRVLDTADAIHYLEMAEKFAAGDFFSVDPKIPLLYPTLTALAHLGGGDFERAGMLISFIASILLIIPVYFLSRQLHGRTVACVACGIVALNGWYADYACRIGPDALACTIWITALLLMERMVRRGGVWMLIAPLAYFALHLCRAEGTAILVAALFGSYILADSPLRVTAKRFIPFVIIVAVLMMIYAGYMRLLTGDVSLNYRAQFLYAGFGMRHIVLFVKTFQTTLGEVFPIMIGPALFLFLGVGLFTPRDTPTAAMDMPKRDLRLELFILFMAAAQWGVSLTVLSAEPRYQMSGLVALTLWSARGLVLVSRQAAVLRSGKFLRLLPCGAVAAFMLFGISTTIGAEYLSRRPQEPREYKVVGLWMKQHLSPGLILTRKPQIGYYAAMPTTGPEPADSLQTAITRARNAGARYLVVDERYTASMVPGLAPLLDPALAPPDLKLVERFEPFPQCKVVVYEVLSVPGPNASSPVR